MFTVKKGVKFPGEGANRGGRGRKYPFDKLEVGEMFFVPDKTGSQFTTYVSLWGRRLGRKFRTQTTHMRQDLITNEWEPCKSGAAGAHKGVAVQRVQ